MKSTDYIDELLAKFLANETLTSAQKVDLAEWINNNQKLYNEISSLYTKEYPSFDNIEFDTDKAWNKVEPALIPQVKHRSLKIQTVGIAASVICLLGLTLFWLFRDETQTLVYANNSPVESDITLPDQSTVKLYPGASVNYKSHKRKGDRVLSLRGEAFFNIKKSNGRAFIVEAYNTQIKVLGTSFLVDAISLNNTNIKVKTGKVSVTNNERSVILTANEQVIVTPESMIKSQLTDNTEDQQIKPALLKFSNTPIDKVIEQLESVFNVEIEIDSSLKKNTITTTVQTENLEDILAELAYLSKSKYKKLSDKKYELYVE